jgi:hypothetical protein
MSGRVEGWDAVAMTDQYGLPIGEVLGDGIRVPLLPKGWTALEGIVLVKCLDDDGHPTWSFRQTEGLNQEETIGALTIQLDIMREQVLDLFRNDD